MTVIRWKKLNKIDKFPSGADIIEEGKKILEEFLPCPFPEWKDKR